MNPKEKITAIKSARILRATRKKLALTQYSVAAILGISQSCYSRMENGKLIPSASDWLEFCVYTKIPSDSLLTGNIESLSPASLTSSKNYGDFKIPKKYSQLRGSKVRAVLPFYYFLIETFGQTKVNQYFKHIKMDQDYLVDFDHQINLELSLDITRYLIEKKHLRQNNLSKLLKPVSSPSTHGNLHKFYENISGSLNKINILIHKASYYETNFNYVIKDQGVNFIDLSIEPKEHLQEINYRKDEVLGNFLCEYKKNYFQQFIHYQNTASKSTAKQVLEITEKNCHYKGAEQCLYRINAA